MTRSPENRDPRFQFERGPPQNRICFSVMRVPLRAPVEGFLGLFFDLGAEGPSFAVSGFRFLDTLPSDREEALGTPLWSADLELGPLAARVL